MGLLATPSVGAPFAKEYAFALIDRESRTFAQTPEGQLEVYATRQLARVALTYRPDADRLRLDRVLVRSCVREPSGV